MQSCFAAARVVLAGVAGLAILIASPLALPGSGFPNVDANRAAPVRSNSSQPRSAGSTSGGIPRMADWARRNPDWAQRPPSMEDCDALVARGGQRQQRLIDCRTAAIENLKKQLGETDAGQGDTPCDSGLHCRRVRPGERVTRPSDEIDQRVYERRSRIETQEPQDSGGSTQDAKSLYSPDVPSGSSGVKGDYLADVRALDALQQQYVNRMDEFERRLESLQSEEQALRRSGEGQDRSLADLENQVQLRDAQLSEEYNQLQRQEAQRELAAQRQQRLQQIAQERAVVEQQRVNTGAEFLGVLNAISQGLALGAQLQGVGSAGGVPRAGAAGGSISLPLPVGVPQTIPGSSSGGGRRPPCTARDPRSCGTN